ncbi:uncharacterized protein LOC135714001 [Ochlerotatus camptorhynchus]|uniref:uncharacterized protein LOC135714001 n=1 Tax=Ochlerotatus camptorhynchus TaxID=644619 RepID=UPI0031E33642
MCSGSDNSIIIEELDVEKVSVVCFFIQLRYPNIIIAVNSYTIETLKIIQRKEIEELLPSPFLAERTRFIHELDSWREAQGLSKVSEQPVTCNSSATRDNNAWPSEETQVTREACTATFLLNASSKGQAILRKYSKTAFLSRSDKKSVTHIVVDEFKNRFSKLSSSELLDRACELKQLFPSEPQETWYQPTFIADSTGKRKKIRKQAKGRLYDRNINYREIDWDRKESKRSETSAKASVDVSEEEAAEYHKVKAWLEHNQDEWEELKVKWKRSSPWRLIEITKTENRTCASILAEYPTLRNHRGYQLVQIDFQQKFSGKEEILFDRWIGFAAATQDILQVEVTDANGKALLACLNADDISEDARNYVIVSLLAHILPRTHVKCIGKKIWKPSYSEAQEGVVIHVKQLSDLESTLSRLFKGCRDRGISSAPFIIVRGPDWRNPTSFTVWNNVVSYKLPSFLKALDVCIKIYKAYDINFPPQSAVIWNLLSSYLFEIDPVKQDASVESLCSAIRLKLSSK